MSRIFRSLIVASSLLACLHASASSLVGTTDVVVGGALQSSDASTDLSSSWRDDKIVLAAREDAASFVASAGEIRGANLEAALLHIRQQAPQLQVSDEQLAQVILAR
ncbi:DUF2388 domain-containing protein [Pseudomonas sp. LRF_L74]|uniref:DUF2388 domain-containing protein n=1 Tax=Pseudomonas sp. LRF_L74 TaxID=3369422 RepID=UPI003F5F0EBE